MKREFSIRLFWDRWTLTSPSISLYSNPFWQSYVLSIQILGLTFNINVQEVLPDGWKPSINTYIPKVCKKNLIIDEHLFFIIPAILINQNPVSMKIHLGVCFMNSIVKIII